MNVVSRALVASLLVVAVLVGCRREAHQTVGAIRIEQPWIRAMAPGAPSAAGFVVLRNTGEAPDRLVSATTADAERVEIHEARRDGDVVRMRALADGLPLPAAGVATLQPSGHHLMLLAPRRRFVEGDTVAIGLNFERAGRVEVRFPVRSLHTTGGAGAHH